MTVASILAVNHFVTSLMLAETVVIPFAVQTASLAAELFLLTNRIAATLIGAENNSIIANPVETYFFFDLA